VFDGRIAEDFKLSSGTFVSVGPLRAKVTMAGDPYVQDVVVAGIDRDAIGLLIFPRIDDIRPVGPTDFLQMPVADVCFRELSCAYEDKLEVPDVNLTGAWLMVKWSVPAMRAAGARLSSWVGMGGRGAPGGRGVRAIHGQQEAPPRRVRLPAPEG
jgi:hypothetical protein